MLKVTSRLLESIIRISVSTPTAQEVIAWGSQQAAPGIKSFLLNFDFLSKSIEPIDSVVESENDHILSKVGSDINIWGLEWCHLIQFTKIDDSLCLKEASSIKGWTSCEFLFSELHL